MKLITSTALLGLASLVSAKEHPQLRASKAVELELFETLGESSCHSATSQSACSAAVDSETNESCVWCKCAAVPPVCVSPDESKGLPPGVFECDASVQEEQPEHPLFEFASVDKTLQLRETVHEKGSESGEFCDASSKSISGYMDLKGSKVCLL